VYYIIFSTRESVIRRSYVCSAFASPSRVDISILTNPPTQWHPPPPVRSVSSAFHRQYGCSRCVHGKRETGAKREKLVLGFSLRSGLKILLLFARYPSRLLSPHLSFRSFSLSLPLRSFLLAFSGSPFHALTSLAVQSTPSVPRLHQTVALAINKKKKRKKKK